MRQTINVRNKSEYFKPTSSKESFDVLNPQSFQCAKSKMEGYETRLYYEYQYTISHNGWCQYVTLTYNDKHIPFCFGIPCLKNSDIRALFNGTRFFRYLERDRGYKMKYFVGAELGEGGKAHNYKGKRGEGNNPHYHLILFFTPVKDWSLVDKVSGEVITKPFLYPYEVANAIKHFWQGNVTLDGSVIKGKQSYTKFRKGICNFGTVDKYGVVKDSKALTYTSKYCVKDSSYKDIESTLLKRSYHYIQKETIKAFPDENDCFKRAAYSKELQDKMIKDFRKEHAYRVLASHGLGVSIIDHVKDPMDPKVLIPSSKGPVNRQIPLYIYRKMFYTVEKDKDNKYYYKLNSLGKQYKLNKLGQDIEDLTKTTYEHIFNLANNLDYFKKYLKSQDCNYPCPFTYIDTSSNEVKLRSSTPLLINNLIKANSLDTLDNIFYKFAVYEKVYKNRFYRVTPFDDAPLLDIERDYRESLQNAHRNRYHIDVSHFDRYKPKYFSFDLHPYFYKDIELFRWFSDVNSFVFCQNDRQNKVQDETWREFRRLLRNVKSRK